MVRYEQLSCMLRKKKCADALTVVKENMEVAMGKMPNTLALLMISLSWLLLGQYLDGGYAEALLF